jgi:hypothetical protein
LVARGDVVDYTQGSRGVRVLVVSDTVFSARYPVIVLIPTELTATCPTFSCPCQPTLLAPTPSTCQESASPIRTPSAPGTVEFPQTL